jgi:hypothetical protein
LTNVGQVRARRDSTRCRAKERAKSPFVRVWMKFGRLNGTNGLAK